MLPEYDDGMVTTIVSVPTKTYRLDFEHNIITQYVDNTEALEQAILKIILTEAEKYLIYDLYYGIYLVDLYGEMPPYVQSEAKHRIKNSILADDRFTLVEYTDESYKDGVLSLDLTVTTAEGQAVSIKGVNISV